MFIPKTHILNIAKIIGAVLIILSVFVFNYFITKQKREADHRLREQIIQEFLQQMVP